MSGYLCPYMESLEQGIVAWNTFLFKLQALTTGTLPTEEFNSEA